MEEIMKEFDRNSMKQIEAERRDLENQLEYTKKKLGDTENQLKMVNAQYQALKDQTHLITSDMISKLKEYEALLQDFTRFIESE